MTNTPFLVNFKDDMPRIVCLSDTHNTHDEIAVPDGDILIHAGDATSLGKIEEIHAFSNWLKSLPHKHKIFVAGNHDLLFESKPDVAKWWLHSSIIYLQDAGVEIEGLKIYGSPWQPWFFDWAFQFKYKEELAEKWALIPADVDVLITHGPPRGILDENPAGFQCGCEALRERVEEIKPKLHIFGHIHHSYGVTEDFGVKFANACNCDENYDAVNPPLVFDL